MKLLASMIILFGLFLIAQPDAVPFPQNGFVNVAFADDEDDGTAAVPPLPPAPSSLFLYVLVILPNEVTVTDENNDDTGREAQGDYRAWPSA